MTATQQRLAMQQPVQTRESTAPQIGQAAPWQPVIRPARQPGGDAGQDASPRRRTPLALVPAPIRKSGRGFAGLCIAVLVAALMAVLVTNITVSNRQYEMVSLKNEQLDLSQSNELLRQQVEHLEAPQNLAAEATKLGMVNPGDVASIDLSNGAVTGTATAADAEDKPSGHVAAPASPSEKQAAAAAASSASTEAEAEPSEAVEAPVGAGAFADLPAPSGADATGNGPADAADSPAQESADGGSDSLNGGTIPAPEFSASGN
ncbi:hypothetical protein AB0333_02805 [Citricoccus sp. NPDC079358]|uniref:hypothetical protein n=1 Tax=Citricoccus sp. NPDC079358 TaxID=3154653 RepID=UPI00344CD065